jgi:two-component system sensor histidine kinase RegB
MGRQLRQREENLAEAQRQIAEANRFQSLATLAAGVAHEMGSPLGTIAIASKDLELSLKRQNASEEWQEDARLIRSEVDRCRQILDRLDQHSTKKTGESPQATTAALICQELGNHLSEKIMARLVIEDRARDFPLMISTEAVLQALVVLIENACEADASGGQVTLDMRIEEGREIVFSVMDNGVGIPNHLRHRIGEPFFTTKKDQTGMGLGIFLVRTLTEHLGGSCRLLPSVPGGTCAILTLPVNSNETKK